MNIQLKKVLLDIEALLRDCDREDDANAIKTSLLQMQNASLESIEYKKCKDVLKRFMHPRGVFCDSALNPNVKSELSLDSAYARQQELEDLFWEKID